MAAARASSPTVSAQSATVSLVVTMVEPRVERRLTTWKRRLARCSERGMQALRRADEGTRTPDPFITSEVLYQLSYVGGSGPV